MATVTLELPNELVAELGSGNLSGDVARILALQLFRDGRVSLVRSAELARTPLEEFRRFACSHGERPPDLVEADERQRELRALEYLNSLGLPAPPWQQPGLNSDLTSDEIDREIAAARRDRRERQRQ